MAVRIPCRISLTKYKGKQRIDKKKTFFENLRGKVQQEIGEIVLVFNEVGFKHKKSVLADCYAPSTLWWDSGSGCLDHLVHLLRPRRTRSVQLDRLAVTKRSHENLVLQRVLLARLLFAGGSDVFRVNAFRRAGRLCCDPALQTGVRELSCSTVASS